MLTQSGMKVFWRLWSGRGLGWADNPSLSTVFTILRVKKWISRASAGGMPSTAEGRWRLLRLWKCCCVTELTNSETAFFWISSYLGNRYSHHLNNFLLIVCLSEPKWCYSLIDLFTHHPFVHRFIQPKEKKKICLHLGPEKQRNLQLATMNAICYSDLCHILILCPNI